MFVQRRNGISRKRQGKSRDVMILSRSPTGDDDTTQERHVIKEEHRLCIRQPAIVRPPVHIIVGQTINRGVDAKTTLLKHRTSVSPPLCFPTSNTVSTITEIMLTPLCSNRYSTVIAPSYAVFRQFQNQFKADLLQTAIIGMPTHSVSL